VDRRFTPLFIVVLIDLIGFGVVIPILPLYAEDHFGAGDVLIMLLLAAFPAAQLIASPILGRLSDAFGRRPVLILSQIGTMISFIVLGFAGSMFWLFVGRIIDGASGGNITTVRAYVNDITTEENRARGFGMISAAFGTGFILGPVLGGLVVKGAQLVPTLAPYSQNAPFFVAALFSLGSILATYFLLPESLPAELRSPLRERKSGTDVGLMQVLSNRGVRLILIFSGATFLAFALFQVSFTLVAARNVFTEMNLEDTEFAISLLLAWIGFLIVLVQSSLVGPLVARFGERRLVVIGALIRIPAFVGVALARTPLVIALSFIPLALGNGVSQPSLQSLISRFAPPSMRGRVLGIFQSVASLSLVIGPLMAGPLLDQVGTSAPDLVGAGLMTVAFLLSFQVLGLSLPSQEGIPAQVEAAPAH
jgi:DHA1 family tetracycline resistance protein-like MFS transporter